VLDKRLKNALKSAWLEWLGAIDNADIGGKRKRALVRYGKIDIGDLHESLISAPIRTQQEWGRFYEQWAEAEVRRSAIELAELEGSAGRAPWERARNEARRKSSARLLDLESKIVVHVQDRGGEIEYAPAAVARALAKGRQSLAPIRVERAMLHLCRNGTARKVQPRKGAPARFVIVV
jgi:hypothetical protein